MDMYGLSVAVYRKVSCCCSSKMTSCSRLAIRAASGSVWLHISPVDASCCAKPCRQHITVLMVARALHSWTPRQQWLCLAAKARHCQASRAVQSCQQLGLR